jgi:hypothetical protein
VHSDEFWQLSMAVNAAFKGLLGSMGESGHICAQVEFAEAKLDLEKGWDQVSEHLVTMAEPLLQDGDVLVIADKVVAAGLGRLADRLLVFSPDPKTISEEDRRILASQVQQHTGFVVTATHLLLADEYQKDLVTLGTDKPNRRCAEIAQLVRNRTGHLVDVIISDTDTGLDVLSPIIGTVTFAATPLGATAGLNLYEAMRCAVAAEFTRGHHRLRPVVVCKPADRRRKREGMGAPRSYDGFLHIDEESGLTYI